MKRVRVTKALLAGLTGLSFLLPALADDRLITDVGTLDKESADKVFPGKRAYSPYAGRSFPTRPLLRDTHLHTMFSFDAGAFGARLGPSDAYRFAKGEEIVASSGQPGEAFAAARFSRRCRSLRQYGVLSGSPGRQSRHPG